jgi:imidazolonepropionase-like amidohydrolase
MKASTLAAAAAILGLMQAGCAVSPTAINSRFSVRQVPFTPDSGSIAVRCGRLIDGIGAAPIANALVVIRDGRVKSVKADASRGDAAAPHVPVLNLSEYTCLPGLIDMHTHLTDRPEDTEKLEIYFTRTDEETLRQSLENASATLLAGFTSARNVGTYVQGADFALRDTVDEGRAAGPRIQASGPYLTIPHGGGDLYIPNYTEPGDNARFHAGVARGAAQFREKAEMLLASGADLLKVIASGAVLAFDSEPGAPEMTQDEIAAVVQVAHAQGKKVAAHAHGAASILMAINAGADTIEHASYLDDADIVAALKRGDVALSMDVYNGDYIDTEGRRMKWPEEFLRKNVETTEIQREGFTKAVKAGVPIVFGTDSAVYPHGLNARQFPIMIQRGMSPMQAIQSATSVAAKYMGWSDRVGALEAGRLGDLIAVRGDPLADVTALQKVEVVIKGGLIFKLPDAAQSK